MPEMRESFRTSARVTPYFRAPTSISLGMSMSVFEPASKRIERRPRTSAESAVICLKEPRKIAREARTVKRMPTIASNLEL
jgi:hypothetical protein